MPQTNVIPDWKATYPHDAPVQKPSGILGLVNQAVSGLTWTSGTVILSVPATYGYVGTGMTITVSGMTPAAYNGTFPGQVASATTISYPLATNPGPETVLGTVSYTTIVPLTVSTTLPATAVPNKPTYAAGTIQMVDVETGQMKLQAVVEEIKSRVEAKVEAKEEPEEEDEDEEEEDTPSPRGGRGRRR